MEDIDGNSVLFLVRNTLAMLLFLANCGSEAPLARAVAATP
jgi:hypothetical protein